MFRNTKEKRGLVKWRAWNLQAKQIRPRKTYQHGITTAVIKDERSWRWNFERHKMNFDISLRVAVSVYLQLICRYFGMSLRYRRYMSYTYFYFKLLSKRFYTFKMLKSNIFHRVFMSRKLLKMWFIQIRFEFGGKFEICILDNFFFTTCRFLLKS